MSKNDNDPPSNVIPFGSRAWVAISQQLVGYYQGLVDEELPDNIAALVQKFEDRTKDKSESTDTCGNAASLDQPRKRSE